MTESEKNWTKVMGLAGKHGFIVQAYGGTAILASHDVQKEQGIFEMTQYKCGLGPHPDKLKKEEIK